MKKLMDRYQEVLAALATMDPNFSSGGAIKEEVFRFAGYGAGGIGDSRKPVALFRIGEYQRSPWETREVWIDLTGKQYHVGHHTGMFAHGLCHVEAPEAFVIDGWLPDTAQLLRKLASIIVEAVEKKTVEVMAIPV